MGDNSILIPGNYDPIGNFTETPQTDQYLLKDKFLSEYETEADKSIVRDNLNVPSKDDIYDLKAVDALITNKVNSKILEHLNSEDPHGILPLVEEKVANVVKIDGSTPFIVPLKGVNPIQDADLSTKKYVDYTIAKHTNAQDPHNVLPEVETLLDKYVKSNEVYSKSQLYTKQDLDKLFNKYIKRDGSTPFTNPQVGFDPLIDSHLSTKRYVDKSMRDHKVEVDPHGFIQILNQRLPVYAKKKDVYDKTQTYSRTQIDSIIYELVNSSIDSAIEGHLESINDKFDNIRLLKYIKLDGSVPFKYPQSGLDAVNESDLVTLRQLSQSINSLSKRFLNCVWKTSGPVESTVGHVEDNTEVPEIMSLQEVCDAIFYGKGISLEVPEYSNIAEKCQITMCIHGSIGLVQHAELYLDEELIYVLLKDEFNNKCVTLDSIPLSHDSVFTFKVYYTNGAVHEETKTVKCCMPVFVGLLPKWKFGNTITMDYLIQLQTEDVNGTQNRFLNCGDNLESLKFKYNFTDSKLRHPFIVLPASYPNLDTMITKSLSFGIDAFDVIDMIPLSVPGINGDMIFKVYIYKQGLAYLDLEVIFNFVSNT